MQICGRRGDKTEQQTCTMHTEKQGMVSLVGIIQSRIIPAHWPRVSVGSVPSPHWLRAMDIIQIVRKWAVGCCELNARNHISSILCEGLTSRVSTPPFTKDAQIPHKNRVGFAMICVHTPIYCKSSLHFLVITMWVLCKWCVILFRTKVCISVQIQCNLSKYFWSVVDWIYSFGTHRYRVMMV